MKNNAISNPPRRIKRSVPSMRKPSMTWRGWPASTGPCRRTSIARRQLSLPNNRWSRSANDALLPKLHWSPRPAKQKQRRSSSKLRSQNWRRKILICKMRWQVPPILSSTLSESSANLRGSIAQQSLKRRSHRLLKSPQVLARGRKMVRMKMKRNQSNTVCLLRMAVRGNMFDRWRTNFCFLRYFAFLSALLSCLLCSPVYFDFVAHKIVRVILESKIALQYKSRKPYLGPLSVPMLARSPKTAPSTIGPDRQYINAAAIPRNMNNCI